jgi:transcriptional regulator with XRE-family HTH domain
MAAEAEPAVADVGRRIAYYRRLRGWNQDKLAYTVGLWRPTIANLERGRHNPLLAAFLRIAAALDVDPCALLHDAEPKPHLTTGMAWHQSGE